MKADAYAAHQARCADLIAALAGGEAVEAKRPLGLARSTSNLFRDRREPAKRRIDLRPFCNVLAVDAEQGWVDVEGTTTYEDLVRATLPRAVMPAVVPQLKTITVGGAAAGVGIEATSFSAGLVHHTLIELEVLLPSGEIVVCSADNDHRDLFRGFANSYGTLGYALRLRLRTRPVRPSVEIGHERFTDAGAFLAQIEAACRSGKEDFVDAVVFDERTFVLTCARFVDAAPWASDYSLDAIYYRSLLAREHDFMRTEDYLWRWDADWFWCSRRFGAQLPLVRRLYGRRHLNSRTYARVMRWNARWGLTRRWARLRGRFSESVIQDVDIPIEHATEFLSFLLREIGIRPIWICPFRAPGGAHGSPLYPLRAGLYINFGFWDVLESHVRLPPGHWNRMIERETARLGGIKSLYSESYFDRTEFDASYGGAAYAALKARYDPGHRLLGLYEKCVHGA